REPTAGRTPDEGDPAGMETAGEPAISRDRILERRRERMLGGEPIIEVEHVGARCGADPPGEISQQLRGAHDVGATVEIENAAVAARLAHCDADGIDA